MTVNNKAYITTMKKLELNRRCSTEPTEENRSFVVCFLKRRGKVRGELRFCRIFLFLLHETAF